MAFNFQFNCIITNKLRKKYFASKGCCCKQVKALECTTGVCCMEWMAAAAAAEETVAAAAA